MFDFFGSVLHSVFFLISFISGNNAFPKPLSAREERECVERMANGDIEARNTLIEHNLRLVAHIAKKYSGSVRDSEDLISLGTIGLIKGISSYDASKGTRLATYASRCIENEILMYIRKTARSKNDVSLEDPLSVDWDGNELLLSDILGSEDDELGRRLEDEEEKKMIHQAVARLNPRDRQIIELRFGLSENENACGKKSEMTQKEVADLLGISQSYISRLEKRIIAGLKKDIAAFYR